MKRMKKTLCVALVLLLMVASVPAAVFAADCSNGHTFTANEIGAKYLKSEATCGKKAVYYYSCTVCGTSSKGTSQEATFEYGEALQHNWGEFVNVAASCTMDEHQKQTCSRCNQAYIRKVPNGEKALGHQEIIRSTGDGKHTFLCTRAGCGFSEEQNCSTVNPVCGVVSICDICCKPFGTGAEHNYDEGKCVVCGDVCEHNTGNHIVVPRVDPTCTTDGHYRYYQCVCGVYFNRCNETTNELSEVIADSATFGVINKLGHQWAEATCIEAKYCTRTGCTATEGNALGHTGGFATCIAEAVCTSCGQSYGTKANHTYATTYTVDRDPTCTVAGEKSKHCTTAGCTAKTDVTAIVAEGHKYDKTKADGDCLNCTYVCEHNNKPVEPIPIVEATCTTDGSSDGYKCADCGKVVIKPRKVDRLGHDIKVFKGVAPTCTTAGKSDGQRCKRVGCDYKVDQVAIEALGHSWSTTKVVTKEPSCAGVGIKGIVCTRSDCKAVKEGTAEYIDKLPHDYSAYKVVTKEATCTEIGEKARVCKICTAKTDVEAIPALGHAFEKISEKAPTCKEKGEINYKCKRTGCTATKTEELALVDHDYVEVKTPATCEKDGYSTFTCKVCDDQYTAKKVEKFGHSFIKYVQDKNTATCYKDGTKTALCDHGCGKKNTITDEGSKIDHKLTDFKTIKEATCTEEGEEEAKCFYFDKCGYSESYPTDKLSHNWSLFKKTIKEPTCTSKGTKAYICIHDDCTAIKEGSIEEIPVLSHDFEISVKKEPDCLNDGKIVYKCKRTGCTQTKEVKIDALGHTYPDNWSTILEPDCQSKGASIKVCLRCNDVISQTLPKTGHVDLDGDSKCDTCDKTIAVVEPEKPSEPEKEPETKPCDCNCHAGGIKAFFFNLVNFFAKIFDKNARVCACGKAH